MENSRRHFNDNDDEEINNKMNEDLMLKKNKTNTMQKISDYRPRSDVLFVCFFNKLKIYASIKLPLTSR